MTHEDYPLSDLDSLLSKDNITEHDLLQFPEKFSEDPKNHSSQTSLTHELEDLSITPTDEPTIVLSDKPKKRKPTSPPEQLFRKLKKSEEARLDYSFTKNPQFQLNLTNKIREKINQ